MADPTLTGTRLTQLATQPGRVPQGLFRVCVRVESEFDNIKQLRGAQGELIELEIDPGFEPAKHAREWGTVVAPPLASPESFRAREGYCCEVQAGDRVYFHYHAITDEYKYVVDGAVYYLLPYEMLYCLVRDGRPQPLSDFLLLHKLVLGVGEQRSATGIIINHHTAERHDTHFGDVAFAAAGARGIHPGQRVIFLDDADLPLTVEGISYFIMHATDLIGFQQR